MAPPFRDWFPNVLGSRGQHTECEPFVQAGMDEFNERLRFELGPGCDATYFAETLPQALGGFWLAQERSECMLCSERMVLAAFGHVVSAATVREWASQQTVKIAGERVPACPDACRRGFWSRTLQNWGVAAQRTDTAIDPDHPSFDAAIAGITAQLKQHQATLAWVDLRSLSGHRFDPRTSKHVLWVIGFKTDENRFITGVICNDPASEGPAVEYRSREFFDAWLGGGFHVCWTVAGIPNVPSHI